MVQAILEGRKTMTRRIVKGGFDVSEMHFNSIEMYSNPLLGTQYYFKDPVDKALLGMKCPLGEIGDTLWVRESIEYFDRGTNDNGYAGTLRYVTDNTEIPWTSIDGSPKKVPSIHMPRSAARIFLMIKDINVEKLQDISMRDVINEGTKHVIDKITGFCGYSYKSGGYNLMTSPQLAFRGLWESIYGDTSWKTNPWVWVISFERISIPS